MAHMSEKLPKLPKDKMFFRKNILYVALVFMLAGLFSFQTCCTATGSTNSQPTLERVTVIPPLENAYKSVWDMMSEKTPENSSCAVTMLKMEPSQPLLAISAYHCVTDRLVQKIKLRWCAMPGKSPCATREVTVFSKDPAHDLVLLLGVEKETHQGYVAPVARTTPSLGETIYMIAAPSNHTRSISRGVLSCMDKNKEGVMLYFTDAAMWFGNSGGGMFNEKGQLIGVAHAIALLQIQLGPFVLNSGAIDNFGMAIGLNHVHDLLRK
jgi:hypothetical protein